MLKRTRPDVSHEIGLPERIGPYRIVEELGRGGMGVVYVAEDERLRRRVALKTLGPGAGDERERLWREARAAAGLNHPGICQVFDVVEDAGDLWIAMELLQGTGLDETLGQGRMSVDDAVQTGLDILAPLGFLHERGLVHRDLKPSNIFRTEVGMKLLDFGLTRGVGDNSDSRLTSTKAIVGTPRYMAPEQWRASGVGPWSDLFSFGAILYEMLSGEYAFDGSDPIDIFHAAAHEEPPPLTGALGIEAVDNVVRRAMAKQPKERYSTARELSDALAASLQRMRALETTGSRGTGGHLAAATVRRFIALPFRVLRPDPDIDFLSTSLPESIGTSLSGLQHLVIRSTRLAGDQDTVDLKRLASEIGVDYALAGTLMRGGSRLRVNAQLLQVPAGTVVWSTQEDAPIEDLFNLHDDLTNRIVKGLAIPLSPEEEARLQRRVIDPKAYELYLRGLHLAAEVRTTTGLLEVRDLLRDSVKRDENFAPSWALYARTCRVLAKYFSTDCEVHQAIAREAFERAFQVDPESPVAHNFYTYHQLEELCDPTGAMIRLLGFISKGSTDANYWAGLVPVLRFLGLYRASLAAHKRASVLSPRIQTGVLHTHLQLGEYEWVAERATEPFLTASVLATMGRDREALDLLRNDARTRTGGLRSSFLGSLLAALEGRGEDCERHCRAAIDHGLRDPEAIYFFGRVAARAGRRDLACDIMVSAIDRGFWSIWTLENDPWLAGLHADARFADALVRARAGHREAFDQFRRARGEELLGITEMRH